MCPSSVFIRTGNGRSALSSIPAFRRSFLLRSPSGQPSIPPPETGGDVAGKAREREAFAQMQPSDTKSGQIKKAGIKTATQEQDRTEIRAAAFHATAAVAIWLVWSESLARGLSSAQGYERTDEPHR